LVTQSRIASFVASFRVRPEQLHPIDVERLTIHVLLAHVHDTLEPEESTGGRGGHPVLTGTRLGDDPALPHPLSQKGLPERVVDLVRPRMVQILPLEVDGSHPHLILQAPGPVEGRRSPDVMPQERLQLPLERGIFPGGFIGGRQFVQGGDECLRDVPATERAETTAHSDGSGWR
jgi:hypothetical protein